MLKYVNQLNQYNLQKKNLGFSIIYQIQGFLEIQFSFIDNRHLRNQEYYFRYVVQHYGS